MLPLEIIPTVIESDLPFPGKIEMYISERTNELSALNPDFLKAMMSQEPSIRQMAEDFTKNKYIPLMPGKPPHKS